MDRAPQADTTPLFYTITCMPCVAQINKLGTSQDSHNLRPDIESTYLIKVWSNFIFVGLSLKLKLIYGTRR